MSFNSFGEKKICTKKHLLKAQAEEVQSMTKKSQRRKMNEFQFIRRKAHLCERKSKRNEYMRRSKQARKSKHAQKQTRAEASMRAKANAGSGNTPHCEANMRECEERHVLTFVSTIRRYIDNLITNSFIRTS